MSVRRWVHNFCTNCVAIPCFSGLSTGRAVIWTKAEKEWGESKRERGRGREGERVGEGEGREREKGREREGGRGAR